MTREGFPRRQAPWLDVQLHLAGASHSNVQSARPFRDSNSEGGSSPPRPGSIAHIGPLFPTPKSLERDLRGVGRLVGFGVLRQYAYRLAWGSAPTATSRL